MGRKSSITKLTPEERSFLEALLREDRHTLDELVAKMRERFADIAISRSGVHRFRVPFNEMMARMREQQAMAGLLVSELGENPDDKAGALMVQAITTLTTQAAMNEHGAEEVDIGTVQKLARAAKDVIAARKVDRQERVAIRQAAREELLAEQEANLQEVAKAQGMDADQVDFWRRKFLGIEV